MTQSLVSEESVFRNPQHLGKFRDSGPFVLGSSPRQLFWMLGCAFKKRPIDKSSWTGVVLISPNFFFFSVSSFVWLAFHPQLRMREFPRLFSPAELAFVFPRYSLFIRPVAYLLSPTFSLDRDVDSAQPVDFLRFPRLRAW